MKQVTISLDSTVASFYERIASVNHLTLEQILSDALFKLAGELSLNALRQNQENKL